MLNRMIRIFSCVALLVIAFMPVAFNLLVNENFQQAYDLIPLYMTGAILNVVIGLVSAVYIVYKQTKVIAKTSFLSAVICIIMNVVLVNYIGVYASPVSNIVGFGIMAMYRGWDINRFVKVNWDMRYMISFVVILILTMALYYTETDYLKYVAMLMTIVFTYITNRKDIKYICSVCLNKFKPVL